MMVLDCNAAFHIALNTVEGNALQMLFMKGETTAAPTLFHAELAHVLEKMAVREHYSRKEAIEIGENAYNLVDEFYEDQLLWPEALSESMRLQHSSYDMFYFVLARRLGATLVTLDKKLQALCDREGVDCIHSIKLPSEEE